MVDEGLPNWSATLARQPDLMPVPVNLFLPVEWLMIASSRTACLSRRARRRVPGRALREPAFCAPLVLGDGFRNCAVIGNPDRTGEGCLRRPWESQATPLNRHYAAWADPCVSSSISPLFWRISLARVTSSGVPVTVTRNSPACNRDSYLS